MIGNPMFTSAWRVPFQQPTPTQQPSATGLDQQAARLSSPASIQARRSLSQNLMRQAMDTSPVQHWAQGAARMAQAIEGVTADWSADRDQQAANKVVDQYQWGLDGAIGAAGKPLDIKSGEPGGIFGFLNKFGGWSDIDQPAGSASTGGLY